MERFAKRKIKIFKYLNFYRVFYSEDSGKNYFVGDYSTNHIDFIANEVKIWYDKRKKQCKCHVVTNDNGLRSAVTDSKGHIKYFETIKDADEWIDSHKYAGMSFKYEVVTDENSV